MKTSKRSTGAFKIENEYQKILSSEFYEKCPKAVFAAIAVSLMSIQTDGDMSKVENGLLEEWEILNKNQIVPQKRPNL